MDRNMGIIISDSDINSETKKEKINNKLSINMKRNLRNLLMVATAIFSICGSAEASNAKVAKAASWLPTNLRVAGIDEDVSTQSDLTEIEEGIYYIRNAEAGTFFAGGNAWGTRLSLKSAGDLIQITKRAGTNGYIMSDKSLVDVKTGAQIGEPSGDSQIFIDQTSPASGYMFHKLTLEEIKVINDKNSTSFYKDVNGDYVDVSTSDKSYYLISYVNLNNQTVYLAEGGIEGSGHHVVSGIYYDGNAPTTAAAVWEIFTRDELVNDLFTNATQEYFMNATPFITNPDFSRNYHANGNPNNNGWTVTKPISAIAGKNENYVAQANNVEFDLYQTLTNIPNGTYGITASGVYEGDEYATGNPHLYAIAGTTSTSKPFKRVDGTTAIGDWSNNFMNDTEKKYMLDTIFVQIWDNTLTVGFAGDRTDVVAYFDNIQLIYYGKESNINTLNKKFNALRTNATKLKNSGDDMSKESKDGLTEALGLAPDTENATELNNAIVQISKAIEEAKKSIDLYKSLVPKYLAEVNKLSTEAQEYYNDNVTVPIVKAGILQSEDQLKAGLKGAQIINAGKGGDVTSFALINPDFDEEMTGWVVEGTCGYNVPPNENFQYKNGKKFVESWAWAASLSDGKMYQTIANLPKGNYKIDAVMQNIQQLDGDKPGTGFYLYANDKKVENTEIGQRVEVEVTVLDGNLTLGVSYESGKGNWICVDDFHLIYMGALDVTGLVAQLNEHIANANALLLMKMNSDEELELRIAKKNAEDLIKSNSKNSDSYTSMIATLSAQNTKAQKSVAIYAAIGDIIDEVNDEIDEAGTNEFNKIVASIITAWTKGEITDGVEETKKMQEAQVTAIKSQNTIGCEMTKAVEDYECNSGYTAGQFSWGNRANAVAKDWYILDADKDYSIVNLNQYFHVNTWSNEAEIGTDGGTPMTIPFTEFWSGYDEGYLKQHHLIIKHKTETGYRKGRYTISIIARLAQCDAGITAPAGYKFSANGIDSKTSYKHNVDANVFWAEDEVDFFVNEEGGSIDFQFEVDNANFTWLAFKMIKLVYQGNTYSDEKAAEIIADANTNMKNTPMNKDVKETLKKAISEFENDHSVDKGQAVILAAQDKEKSIELYDYIYNQIADYIDKEASYNNDAGFETLGRQAFDKAIDAALDAYNARTLTEDDREIAAKAYILGLTSQSEGDFTELIVNPSFETGNYTGWTVDGTTGGETKIANIANESRYAMDPMDGNYLYNTWNGGVGYPIHQTISGLSAGKYILSALMTSTNSGSDVRTVHLNAGTYTVGVPGQGDGTSTKVELTFEVGSNASIEITAWASTNADATLDGTDKSWFKVDDFHLYYEGASDIKDLLVQLANACVYADPYINQPMNKDILKPLRESYDKAKVILADDINTKATGDEIVKLKDEIIAYTDATLASIDIYKEVYEFYTIAMTLDEDGQNAFRKLAQDVINAYQNRTITDGISEISHLEGWLRTATKSQTSHNSNWTGAILNNSFEDGMSCWKTMSGYKSFKAQDNNPVWSGTHKKLYAFRDNTGSTKMKANFYQDIDTVQPGVYKLKARYYTNSSTMTIYGNDLKGTLTPCTSKEPYKEIEQLVLCWDGKRITLGFVGDLYTNEVIRVDSIALTFLSTDLDIKNELVSDTVKYYNKLKEAQEKAYIAYRNNSQPDELSAVIEAIRQAKESAEYYKKAKFYMDSAWNYMLHSNVYSKEAKNQCMNLYNQMKSGYENGTLSNSDCKQMLYNFFQNGFEGFSDKNASNKDVYQNYPILNYIFDAWSLTDTWGYEIYANANFHVNIWSKEIDPTNITPENSEMIPPFIEYWTNSYGGTTLEDGTIHAKAIDLEPGLYKMKVLVRVANESGNVAPEDFKGVSLHVETDRIKENNGVQHFYSDTISVCKGDLHKDGSLDVISQVFVLDSIIIRAKDNGDAHIYFDVENANVNWLAWKFCQFVKIRDLRFDEENDLASDEEIKELKDLITRDEGKKIGFNKTEYSTYANRDIIQAHRNAKDYLEKNSEIDPEINNHHLTKYQVNEYINTLKDESKWITQVGDTNCIYNPYFALVRANYYAPLYGWTITDNSVELPRTGGTNTTSATADQTWTKFANNRKARNLNGEWNTFSTAATFQFEKANEFRSPKSVYGYGNEAGFEMPLDPDQAYTLTFQYGYRKEGANGTVIFEIKNKKSGAVISSTKWTPNVCVADTMNIPEVKQIIFNTPEHAKYDNSLKNFDNLDMYEFVVRNEDPTNLWTMVISNIKLMCYPNAHMYINENAHWGTFIASFETDLNDPMYDDIDVYVVTGKDKEPHPWYDLETGDFKGNYTSLILSQDFYVQYKNGKGTTTTVGGNFKRDKVIPPHTPVILHKSNGGFDGYVHGKNTVGERIDSVRYYREIDRYTGKLKNPSSVYLEGHEGYLTTVRPDTLDPKTAENGWYVLQLKANEKEASFYKVNQSSDKLKNDKGVITPLTIPANRCYLVDPLAGQTGSANLRRLVFSLDEVLEMTTSIKNSENQNDDIEIIGIYSINGMLQDDLKPGTNIIKMSDGSVRKKVIK